MGRFSSNNPFQHAAAPSSTHVDDVPPPAGPPPSHQNNNDDNNNYYAPPPGPPPSYHRPQDGRGENEDEDYAPPPGPPPSSSAAPGQHDWQSVVPDTALFPPPPDLFAGFDRSGASNATEEQARAGEDWCRRYGLAAPLGLAVGPNSGLGMFALRRQQVSGGCGGWGLEPVRMVQPETNTFRGSLTRLMEEGGGGGGGVWSLVTDKKAGDATVIGYPPVYLVQRDSPLLSSSSSPTPSSSSTTKRTIYYEVKILGPNDAPRPPPSSSSSTTSSSHHHHHRFWGHSTGQGFLSSSSSPNNNEEGEIGLALGFTALPYPPFRMPGWHRGSLAVHADDGHKYVNDMWGGKEFTAPFRPGQTVGIGMTFSAAGSGSGSAQPPSYHRGDGDKGKGAAAAAGGGGGRIEVEVFFTRDGKLDGSWDVHEELDASTDLPRTGLEGYHDLAIAVGTFQNVAVDIVLDPTRWMYRGVHR